MKRNETTEWSKRGKETAPENTVKRIRELLDKAGIETRYDDTPCDVGGMYCGRISVTALESSTIGSNGKGSSREFCMASAYAELMERLQNKMFAAGPTPADSDYYTKEQELLHMPWYTVRGEYQPECVLELKKQLAATVKKRSIFDPDPMDLVDALLEDASSCGEGRYTLRPFWSVKEHKEVLLPARLLLAFQMSNGMAAGNTLEEAIVQAGSEIFERKANIAVFEKSITPPQIPRAYIEAHYPYIARVMREIEAFGPYRIYMLDCSLGKGYPAACSILINTEKQTFGVKFGAHPNMGVALERTLSEIMQGRTLENFSRSGYPNFRAEDLNQYTNTWNTIKVGTGYFPASLLYDKPDYEFRPWPDITGMDNRQMMRLVLDKLMETSGDVYIQDVSFLGFPTVFIYAPGLSPALPVDVRQLKQDKLRGHALCAMRHLDTATDEEIARLLRFVRLNRYALIENRINNFGWFTFKSTMPGAPDEAGFLAALCYYRLGQVSEAMQTLQSMKGLTAHMTPENQALYNGVLYYISGLANGRSVEEVSTVVRKMCSDEAAEKVLFALSDPKKVLERVYPVCNHGDCDHCRYNGDCENKQAVAFFFKLLELEAKNDPQTRELAKLFA